MSSRAARRTHHDTSSYSARVSSDRQDTSNRSSGTGPWLSLETAHLAPSRERTPLSEHRLYLLQACVRSLFDLMLPKANHRPTHSSEFRATSPIPVPITQTLVPPIGRKLTAPTPESPPVPKVTIDEDRNATRREGNVRFAREP